jgi:hypothetical protein
VVQGIILVLLVAGGVSTFSLYFREWATSPELVREADGDLAAAARYLDSADTDGKTIYVAAAHYRHPTLAFLSQKYEQLKWLPQSETLVFPASGEALYFYPYNSPAPAWSLPYLEAGSLVHQESDESGQPLFSVYRLAQQPTLALSNPADANFENAITLLGYDLQPAAAGQPFSVLLYWRAGPQPPAGTVLNPTPFVHLEDRWGHRWSQGEIRAYPAEQWRPGEMIIQHVAVPVPAGTPPGDYRLRVGLFDPGNGLRLARLDEAGRYQGDTYSIEDVVISAGLPPDPLPQPSFPVNQTAAAGLQLLGYERGGRSVFSGESFDVALWWLAERPLAPMSRQLLLAGQDEQRLLLVEGDPVQGSYPFANWAVPQFLVDRQTVRIPNDLPAGDYRLVLRLLGEGQEAQYAVDLGLLRAETSERVYERPPVTYSLEASFGQEITLVGYDLVAGAAGRNHRLTLVWEAASQPAGDYTVFVHLLRPDGGCCVWQEDAMPRQGSYPTSRWLAGEVISDSYQINLPPELPAASYPLEVGLYLAETGRRLAVRQAGQPEADALFLRPLVVAP